MQNSTERKSDHRRGNRTAENDDDGMFADEHVQIAAHEHHYCYDNDAGHEPNARHDIHGELRRVREQPSVLGGDAAHPEPRNQNPTSLQLKTRKG